MKIKFEIPKLPKRHFYSEETTPFRFHISDKTWKALERRTEALGWSQNQAIGLVLDQFLHSTNKLSALPERQVKNFNDSNSTARSIRIDKALNNGIAKWCKKAQIKKTRFILVALDFWLYP